MELMKRNAIKGSLLAINNQQLRVNGNIGSQREQFAYGHQQGTDPKHNCLWAEFGYKEVLTYYDLRNMYERQGIAGGVIDMHAELAFQNLPMLIESEEEEPRTAIDKEFDKFCKRTSFLHKYMDATIRRSVGSYSALIIQIADNETWNTPAENVSPDNIVGFIPVWEHQLTVSTYDQGTLSATYGEPLSFSYNEYDFNNSTTRNSSPQRSVTIDASRVIWYGDLYANGSATLLGNQMLKKGYNDFATLEKLIGAGGEGAYKNAARHIATSFDKDTDIGDMAKMYGVTVEEMGDIFQEMTSDLNSNFDAGIFGKAATYTVLSTSLPDMRETFDNALMSAAASVRYPGTVIVGQQTGERASGEDGLVTAKRSTSYRNNVLTPELLASMRKFQSIGMWTGSEFDVIWESLLDASESEKIENAFKMADTNAKVAPGMDPIYSNAEIRVTRGYEPDIELTKEENKLIRDGGTQDPLPGDEEDM